MPPLEAHAVATLLLAAVALALYASERIPLELTSLLLLVALLVGFQAVPFRIDGDAVPASRFLAHFGNPALVTIIALLVCAKGLETTGALLPVARLLGTVWTAAGPAALLLTMVVSAGLSMFLNNTPLIAMLLPLLVSASIRSRTPASKILMPVGYATIIGGMATTIGTSTNLLVVDIAVDLGLPRFGLFDFAAVVAVGALPAFVFLWLLAPRMLPARNAPMSDTAPRMFEAMLLVTDDSYPSGRQLREVRARMGNRVRIERIERGENLRLARLPSVTLQAGDRIYVSDTPDNLKAYEKRLGTPLYGGADFDQRVSEGGELAEGGQQLAEVVVTPGSPLEDQPLAAGELAARFGLQPIAVHRPAGAAEADGDRLLRAGDVVLVQGRRRRIRKLQESGRLLLLDGRMELPHTDRAALAGLIMVAVVLAAAFQVAPILVAAVAGAVAMLLTGCVSWTQLREAVDARLALVIVAALALGDALTFTGATTWLAAGFVGVAGDLPPIVVLSALMLSVALLTEIVTNNAAAVLGTPIAVAIAAELGLDPVPFVLAVLFGANMSYLTPIGYQTNLLVMTAGGYRFSDFFRVGAVLQVLIWLSLSVALPVMFPP
jgi:di/tricarboxylate transporter